MARLLSIFKTIPPVLILVGSFLYLAQNLCAEPKPVDLQHKINNQHAKIKATRQRIVESEQFMANLVEKEAHIIREIEVLKSTGWIKKWPLQRNAITSW